MLSQLSSLRPHWLMTPRTIRRASTRLVQAIPSLRDIAHDGWLCKFTIYSSWKFHQLAAGQLLSGQPVRYGKGRRYGRSIIYKITPAGKVRKREAVRLVHHVQNHTCTLLKPARRVAVLSQPSSLWPHWLRPPSIYTIRRASTCRYKQFSKFVRISSSCK